MRDYRPTIALWKAAAVLSMDVLSAHVTKGILILLARRASSRLILTDEAFHHARHVRHGRNGCCFNQGRQPQTLFVCKVADGTHPQKAQKDTVLTAAAGKTVLSTEYRVLSAE